MRHPQIEGMMSYTAMQPNEFVPFFVLMAAVFGGWGLIRFVRSRSKLSRIAGYCCSVAIFVVSGFLLFLNGCGLAKRYRSVPCFSPDSGYMAQITELDFGPGSFNTKVELRSRWQLFPRTVLASHNAPGDIDAKWLSNSELIIRYAAGYPNDRDYTVPCEQQFKSVKIACEPVAGYTLHPTPTSLRGQQLRVAIDQRYREISDAHAIKGNAVQITDVLLKYISEGTSYLEALRTLMAAGFLVNRQSPDQDVGHYSLRSTCRADINVALYWHGPTDSGVVQKITGWIDVTCP
jgi:hypothetical protein